MENYKKWLQDVKQDLSDSTVRTYISDLNQFFKVCGGNKRFDRHAIDKYKEWMKENKLAIISMNRKISSLKRYNQYLLFTGQIKEMVVHESDQNSIQNERNPTKVTNEEVIDFLETVKKKPSRLKVRNVSMVYLMANTGLRREEICNLKLSDLKKVNGGYQIYIVGKGAKQRKVSLNDLALEAIQSYLKIRNKSKYAKTSPYVYLSQRGEKLTVSAINDMFDFYTGSDFRRETDEDTLTPHDLRHNYASTMLEENILTPVELQTQLGHASLATTGLYTHARQPAIMSKIKNSGIGSL